MTRPDTKEVTVNGLARAGPDLVLGTSGMGINLLHGQIRAAAGKLS